MIMIIKAWLIASPSIIAHSSKKKFFFVIGVKGDRFWNEKKKKKKTYVAFFSALAEAKDICLYLKPLLKPLTNLENTIEFSDIKPQLKPLLHVVCLIWANSKYYCNSAKIIVLIRQICNLLIEQVSFHCSKNGEGGEKNFAMIIIKINFF